MPTEKYANNGASTLNGAINSSVTSLVVTAATSFPTSGNFRILIGTEIIIVGVVSGATFSSLTRGAENTTAAAHGNGDAVTLILTAGSMVKNPRSMSAKGDVEYLDATLSPASLAAPGADGLYVASFASGIPSWVAASAVGGEITGAIKMFGGTSDPSGYFICDGRAVSRATYVDLFNVIGTTYGVGNGATTFNIPDLRQRFPLGLAASGTGNALGTTGGQIDHTHAIADHTHTLPAHSHVISAKRIGIFIDDDQNSAIQVRDGQIIYKSADSTYYSPDCGVFANGTGGKSDYGLAATTTATDGSGTSGSTALSPATNNPPYQVVNFIIKY